MVGALAKGVPPDETVYHLRLVPVAVRVALGPPTHKFTGVVTVGAAGRVIGLMFR